MLVKFLVLLNMSYANTTADLAQKVIELRQDVESKNEYYETEKEKVYNELKSIGAKKAELEANIQSDRLRNQQMQTKITSLEKSIRETAALSDDLGPLYQKYSAELKNYIQTSLPYKRADRLKAVEEINTRVDKKEMSVAKAIIHLWSLIEDEKRLTRENSLEKEIVMINNKEKLAQIVRLGMMLMYFSTEDGQIGQLAKVGDEWKYSVFTDAGKKQQVQDLVLALKKQVRSGYFEVPVQAEASL